MVFWTFLFPPLGGEFSLKTPVLQAFGGNVTFYTKLPSKSVQLLGRSPKRELGVVYTIGGMTSLLHQLGFSYKKPKGVPGKAKREEQEVFIEEYNKVKEKGLLYFADSTHPMLNPVLSSGWIRKGKEFDVKTNSGRERVNINGAIELNTLSVVSRSCDRVNGKSMRGLLRAIRAKHPRERDMYIVLDNAAYNKSNRVRDLAKELGKDIIFTAVFAKFKSDREVVEVYEEECYG